ncbi:hypothetical protein ACLOJK_014890 [Asimina triloba]
MAAPLWPVESLHLLCRHRRREPQAVGSFPNPTTARSEGSLPDLGDGSNPMAKSFSRHRPPLFDQQSFLFSSINSVRSLLFINIGHQQEAGKKPIRPAFLVEAADPYADPSFIIGINHGIVDRRPICKHGSNASSLNLEPNQWGTKS